MEVQIVDADAVARLLPFPVLIDALHRSLLGEAAAPLRTVHAAGASAGSPLNLYLMPAWDDELVAVKLATVVPANTGRGLPTVQALVAIFDRSTGAPRFVADGTQITLRRTAAASALASRLLSREGSSRLLIVGSGALSAYMAEAHISVRPIERISIWGRRRERADSAAARVRVRTPPHVTVEVVDDLARAVATADIVSCATSAREPVIAGRWLSDGVHLDLVGAHTPDAREADDLAIQRGRVWMDSRSACMAEAGDLLIPLGHGVVGAERLVGDLADLVRGAVPGRAGASEITIFKSVGTAVADLAAASALCEQIMARQPEGKTGALNTQP